MNTGIYKITNPKNKIYIGLSKNLNKRFLDYKYPCNIKNQYLIYNSIKKYGWENHKFEVIEYCEISQLEEKEKYWINQYKSNKLENDNGLNLTNGGNNPPIQNKPKSKEHIEKIRQALIGKKHSEETKEKIRQKRLLQVIPKEVYEKNALKRMKPCILYNKLENISYEANSLNEMCKITGLSLAGLSSIRKKETKKYKFQYV